MHVSLVISSETLEANYLESIIERNCLLLNGRLVATPACISFILTKVEDPQNELATFTYPPCHAALFYSNLRRMLRTTVFRRPLQPSSMPKYTNSKTPIPVSRQAWP